MAAEIKVPDIGGFTGVEVIEVLVQAGDSVAQEASLITLESDKAAMDIPAPQAGTVKELRVKAGDKVSEGDVILVLEEGAGSTAAADAAPAAAAPADATQPSKGGGSNAPPPPAPAPAAASSPPPPGATADRPVATPATTPAPAPAATPATPATSGKPYASPSVRRLARELGADLKLISGTGPKQRITKDDVKQFIRHALSGGTAAGAAPAATPPDIDFTSFGPCDTEPRPRMAMLTARNMHLSWTTIPHVTQFNEADITELENFRKEQQQEAANKGVKLTLVSFLLKAIASTLREFPVFNSSLSGDGKSLVSKHYCHIGMAVNGPAGLVVPVIRDVDRKGVYQIAKEVQQLATLARERKLKPADMAGGCFTLSSLGGLGGLQFTPIINPPEVAILGVSHSIMRPVYNADSGSFEPRLMLPLALSYDHRVINGVDGARFSQHLGGLLGDLPRIIL